MKYKTMEYFRKLADEVNKELGTTRTIDTNPKVLDLLFTTKITKNTKVNLLDRMGVGSKKPPLSVEMPLFTVNNPYFIYKAIGEKGIPKELVFDWLKTNNYFTGWNEWCEFWLNSFLTIPIDILTNSFLKPSKSQNVTLNE